MTARGELFCDEDVRDAAEEKFGKRIPKYEYIRIDPKWKDKWIVEDYPCSGYIEYLDKDEKAIATVTFEVKFVIEEYMYGRLIQAYPKKLKFKLGGNDGNKNKLDTKKR